MIDFQNQKSAFIAIVGRPNVGKSTFINSYAGKACAKTGNKPGVTKGKQWIRLNKQVELLDTPGILWPKFEDQTVGLRLALIGSIKDEILQIEELAYELIKYGTPRICLDNIFKNTRKCYDFVKTQNANINGVTGINERDTLEAIFNMGVRRWHIGVISTSSNFYKTLDPLITNPPQYLEFLEE